jgi:hypothetical protein
LIFDDPAELGKPQPPFPNFAEFAEFTEKRRKVAFGGTLRAE